MGAINQPATCNNLMKGNGRRDVIVYGYIRNNFDERCLIDIIIGIIVQFYMNAAGSLYVFGHGSYGCLGMKKYKNKFCNEPALCKPFHRNNAIDVAAGFGHTLIVDIDHNVWSCGWNGAGQLGTGNTNSSNVYRKITLAHRVIAVSAGNCHSLLLCDNGWVQSFGSNSYGQLGHRYNKDSLVPKTIEMLKKYTIVQISVCMNCSATLTKDCELFCFGKNECGECGIGVSIRIAFGTPTKVKLSEEIAFVECGSDHSLLITRKSLIYSFGYGGSGQLGHGDVDLRCSPTLIDALKHIKMKTCAAGKSHSICIDEDGKIRSFGSNKHCQCGLAVSIAMQQRPMIIEWFEVNNIKAKGCSAARNQSCVISNDGNLFVFGCNWSHQLGLKQQRDAFTPPTQLLLPNNAISNVQKVSMGHSHSALIS